MSIVKASFNICVVRPPGYVWSSVFQELADLLFFSLEDLGFFVKITENKITSSAVNVVIGAHLLEYKMIISLPSDTIILNTEQMGAGSRKWNEKIKLLVSKYASWDYSVKNIEEFRQQGLQEPKFFKLGYHPKMERIESNLTKDIDVLFYGGITPDRAFILNGLLKNHVRVVHLSGVFGAERDAFIARSKIVLNLHQHNTKILEIVRIHYLMNNGKVVVSQYDEDSTGGEDYKEGLVLAHYNEIVATCLALCASDSRLAEAAENSLSTIKKINAVEIMSKMIRC